jgi:hypothetical protein
MQIKVQFFKTIGVPTEPVANAFYFVENEDETVSMYVTDQDGELSSPGNPEFVIAVMDAAMTLKADRSAIIASTLLASSVVDLNEGTAEKQVLYTVPASTRAKPSQIDIDFLSDEPTDAEFTVGWNVGADDVLTDPFHLADLITDTAEGGPLLAPSRSVRVGTAGQALGLKVTTPEGSALTARINVFGHETDADGVPVSSL